MKISRMLTATLAGLAVVPAAALGHGSMSDPPSRVYQCFFTAKDHPACAEAWAANPQALYDWTEVNIGNAAGRHRELIPDGTLCSAGRDKYAAFDRTVTWPATTLRPDADGKYTLKWQSTAPHATEYYRVYITKPSYDPSRPLGWGDLELVHDSGRGPAEASTTLRMSLPERTGRQLIYTVWQRSDSPEAFYSCSDVVMGQEGTTPGPAPSPDPTPAPAPDPTPAPAPTPTNLRVTGTIASDWGGGYCRDVVVRNTGTAAIAWTIPVEVDGRITSFWNAKAEGGATTGTIRVSGEYWNAVLEGGQEATFGYCANRTSTTPAPAPQPDPSPAPPPDEHHDHDPAPTPAPAPDPAPAPAPTPTPAPAPTPTPTPAPAPAPAPAPVPAPAPGAKKVIAYFPAWGVYGRNFHVADIPAEGLTHVNYAFANIANGRCVLGDPYADIDRFYPGDSWDSGSMRGSFNQLRKLKAQHPGLRAMISVGGWTWSKGFSDAALTDASRREFVSSCVSLYLRTDSNGDGVRDGYGDVFDGIDIDWEYPVSGGDSGMVNRPEDKRNYTLLMQEFRRQLNALDQSDGVNRKYELSIAAPAGVDKIANLEVAALVEPLDFVNVMTYDFHGAWDSTTGHNAPLVSPPGSPGDARYDQTDAIAAFLDGGAPASKVTLGLPFYGRGWTGVGTADNGRFQPATGASNGTWEAGMHDYKDLAANYVGKPGWTRLWDDVAKSPYLWNATSRTFISYDDPQSLRIKAAWARERGLGGVMIWELSSDTSGDVLLNAVNDGLGGAPAPQPQPDPAPAPAPAPNPTPAPTPAPSPAPTPTPAPAPAPTPAPQPTPAPAPGGLRVTGTITSDWGSGYCRDVAVLNQGTSTVYWDVPVTVEGRINSLWNGKAAGGATTGTIRVSGEFWNARLDGGQTVTFGYCAAREAGTPQPTPAPAPSPAPAPAPAPAPTPAPAPSPDGTTVTRTITSDWGSGFCADVTVRPASVVPVTWSAELQVGGTITSIWDATTPGSTGTVTVRGASWNPTASSGSPAKFGYCAQR